MNAVPNLRPVGFEATPAVLELGEITLAGLEAVEASSDRRRVNELAQRSLLSAAGVETEVTQAPTEKEFLRKKLLAQMMKSGNPERLFQQICAGVATRNPKSPTGATFIKASTGRWLAQEVTNQVTRMAGNAIIMRRREAGIIRGVNLVKNDAEMWIGEESTNTDDLELVRGGQATTENLFLAQCDDVETIEATYREWYDSIEIALGALANAVMMEGDAVMQYGPFCRWEEGPNGLTQVIDDLDDYISRELTRRNDGPQQSVPASTNDDLAKIFG